MSNKVNIDLLNRWFLQKNWAPFPFQQQTWKAYLKGENGLLNAPTGSGKTYALALPILLEGLQNQNTRAASSTKSKKQIGIQAIWISPIRALTKDIQKAIQEAANGLGLEWEVAVRTGDTSTKERSKQKRNQPPFLITTPESLHIMLSQRNSSELFQNLKAIVVDEWHELLGNKRGILIETALSRIRSLSPNIRIWGISATIGNLSEAQQVLLGIENTTRKQTLIKADIHKQIEVVSVMPDEVETYPWGGHLGIKLLPKIIPLLHAANTTLIFTNTRSQTEIWYQKLLDAAPEFAGWIAMHHGSLSNETRAWVEEALHRGSLKAVVCTSSLDLGVDFRPVDQIIQIGGPKGVSRFMQRAGRSGHRPDAISKIYFVPTHALELMEASALRNAISEQYLESRQPIVRAFDVLAQYLVTLAIGDGFDPAIIYREIKNTFCFQYMTWDEWQWILNFITTGGETMYAYDEFKKVEIDADGIWRVHNKRLAMQHRVSIGTISSDSSLSVKYISGGHLGNVEEYFVSKLKPGDVFWFAGKNLEIVSIKDMTVLVRRSTLKNGLIPSWQGGRMPLSSKLSDMLRKGMTAYTQGQPLDLEYAHIVPLLTLQQQLSTIPAQEELLIEKLDTKDGHHVFIYPFEGRFVHEGLASLVAYRISRLLPISFSMSFNDYGFELLSDQPIPIEEALGDDLFGEDNLFNDMLHSINAAEMARRKFRDIATISGLVFTGFPGKQLKTRHLQASSSMFFKVFTENDPNNLLLKQAYEEVMNDQLEEVRLRKALNRINTHRITVVELTAPSPFAFPIMVERLREKLTSEKLEDRVKKMQLKLKK
ncbi:MAG: ligase-associated DNA damage response DEXH box helicase [Bacteroidia bacterium]|jgi:ATP-dependent Lhr-like helicase|nr:ligase-associated DNA damage response DEXH box helicase [Bacteroidia bacterium]